MNALLLDIYYECKPFVPWSLRMALRRVRARRLRHRFSDVWPIKQAAGRPPAQWQGWPDGHQFAFVVTHDVEGPRGLARCRALAEFEMDAGFRSSFNFIPEGSYETPPELRRFLTDHGFEIGVHDLHHDGKLYRTRTAFRRNAHRINEYLESWEAVGFRSGFTLHNLQWLKDLRADYDSSTCDNDPFEPQPDGVDTIFPFWVARDDGTGYVELPSTLAQDSTMFLVLQEKTIDIWRQKLDWVAAHGGLALVNVHPDYISFEPRRRSSEYAAGLYREFLDDVNQRYRHACWHALPRDVAAYIRQQNVPSSGAPTAAQFV